MNRRLARAVVTAVAASLALRAAHAAQLSWGTTPSERTTALPGDDLTPTPGFVATRAITIDAPVSDVWPWLAQLGQGRGGFYSYDALENLVGCDIHSADRVVPDWQSPAVGDAVHLHPGAAVPVALVDPESALVLHGPAGPVDGDGDGSAPFVFTWAFVLRPLDDGRTRVLVRERYAYETPATGLMITAVSWVSFVMSTKMLRGIAGRAEGLAASR